MTGGLTRRYRDSQEEHHVKAEADIGLLCFHTKDPRPQNCERITSDCFKFPQFVVYCHSRPGKHTSVRVRMRQEVTEVSEERRAGEVERTLDHRDADDCPAILGSLYACVCEFHRRPVWSCLLHSDRALHISSSGYIAGVQGRGSRGHFQGIDINTLQTKRSFSFFLIVAHDTP